jgi:hypothetical protein
MVPMKKKSSDALFEVPASAPRPHSEDVALEARTNFQSRAGRSGADFKVMALEHLVAAGASIERRNFRIARFPVDAEVLGKNGRQFLVLARGTPDEQRFSGLRRTDTVEKVGFIAMNLARLQRLPILLITSDLPKASTQTARYLEALSKDVWDVVAYRGDLRGFQRLCSHLQGPLDVDRKPPAPWRGNGPGPEPRLFDPDR